MSPLCPSNLEANNISLAAPTGVDGIKCNTDPVTAGLTVVNTGDATVTAFELTYSLNGGPEQPFSWTGTLPSFTSLLVEIGTVNPVSGSNTFEAAVVSVNGMDDEDPNGNAISSDFMAISAPIDVTLSIILDNYPGETTWEITDEFGFLVHQGGPYQAGDNSFQGSFCLALETCYAFTIYDQIGDGICCGFGTGSYVLSDQFGNTLASGGDFNFEESTSFCTLPVSLEENSALQSLHLYPNPARDQFVIDAGAAGMVRSVTVFDAVGRQVWQTSGSQASAGQIEIPIGGLGVGMYLVQVHTDQGIAVRRLLIQR
jgi:hypothetical protein